MHFGGVIDPQFDGSGYQVFVAACLSRMEQWIIYPAVNHLLHPFTSPSSPPPSPLSLKLQSSMA